MPVGVALEAKALEMFRVPEGPEDDMDVERGLAAGDSAKDVRGRSFAAAQRGFTFCAMLINEQRIFCGNWWKAAKDGFVSLRPYKAFPNSE